MATTSGTRPAPQQPSPAPAAAKPAPAPVPNGDPDFNAAVEEWRRRQR
jgi:hypothetical protein